MPWMEVVVIIHKLGVNTHYVQSAVRCLEMKRLKTQAEEEGI